MKLWGGDLAEFLKYGGNNERTMSNNQSARNAIRTVYVVVALLVTTAIAVPANPAYSTWGVRMPNAERNVPMATSGTNLYMAWVNNDTGYCNVFFAKSTDGGKTLKTMMISAPNKGNIIDENTQISASGSNVYVTWWTNKTGTLMPVFRASNDNGDTFAKAITLNSTG
jgi:hypothetical protein